MSNTHGVSPHLLIDTHCHLYSDPLAGSVDAVLARAADRDVTRVIVPAYDPPSWSDVAKLKIQYPSLAQPREVIFGTGSLRVLRRTS